MQNTPPAPEDDTTSADGIGVLDLFAGAGGLSFGFHQGSNRYTTVRAVEMDLAAAATYAQNFGPVVYAGDIRRWLQDEPTPDADVVLGGPPCQGFSTLGKQDPSDLRNTLWRPYAEVVRRSMPRAFVMENVPAFLKSGEYAAFVEAFAGGELADFDIRAEVLNAADFGAPQARKRVIVIGVRRDLEHPGHPRTRPEDRATVREAFRGIRPFAGDLSLPPRRTPFGRAWLPGPFKGQDLHVTRDWSPLYLQRFRAIPYGGSRLDLPDELSMDCWRNNPRSASDVMGRLEWDKPSVTIRTEFFKPEKGRFVHPTQHRAITHWEAARLQGFPDDYRWVGDRAQIARQIGNAVPIRLGEALGSHLARVL
ncbi:MAG: DNA cytosine methyltransferase [Cellulomonas sp.]